MFKLKLFKTALFILFSSQIIYSQKKDMSIIDFLNIPGISNVSLSPNSSKILYILSESNWKENKQIPNLWLANLSDRISQKITFEKKGIGNPEWSPDSKWISFTSSKDGFVDNEDDEFNSRNNQIYLLPTKIGSAKKLSNHRTGVSNVKWSKDSKYLYFLASDAKSKDEITAEKEGYDVYSFDNNKKQRHLWRIDLNGKEERITDGDFSVLNYDLSDDNKKILLQKGPNPFLEFRSLSELWIMDMELSKEIQLTNNSISESSAKISPNGDKVLFIADCNENFEEYYNRNLFEVSTDGSGLPKIISKDFDHEIYSFEFSNKNEELFILVNMGAFTQLWKMNVLKNTFSQITKGNHSLTNWDYNSNKNLHVFGINTIKNPGDIYSLGKNQKKITSHYDYLVREFNLPIQKLISWNGEDGVGVEGVLYLPHNFSETKKYPLVVQTHGGPRSSDKFGFSRSATRYNAVLTGEGYVVLQPNYRGSTGYGDDFLRDMVGSYFNQSHLDVMTGVDYLIDKGIADPDKLIKMGWSAGGHMTNKIITHTNRFKAASSGAGAVNWIGMYAQSDVRLNRTAWFGGTPWEKGAPIDVYWNNSPLKDIHKVKTPTLVLVGGSDPRVPPPQSIELFRALRSLGVETKLLIAPGEPHGWRKLSHRLTKINSELEWFAKYALDKKYEYEKYDR
ncbi:MAG: S9 family peptidase [Flavobacteriales bacterium]|nr:MAG: S9 family peptidase [Flavobacteriales bacterium]